MNLPDGSEIIINHLLSLDIKKDYMEYNQNVRKYARYNHYPNNFIIFLLIFLTFFYFFSKLLNFTFFF